MTRTEAIFDIIKCLPELELVDLLEKIHDHAQANEMGHIFTPFYDDTYEVEELKSEILVLQNQVRDLDFDILNWKGQAELIECQCKNEDKHGETSIMCCNHCGKPTEEFWTKKTEV